MRFRPSGGLQPNPQKSDRAAMEARAEVIGEKSSTDSVFGRSRYEHEIQRSENLAAGLPPDALAEAAKPPVDPDQRNREYREPHKWPQRPGLNR